MKNRFLTLLTVTMLAGSILVGCGGNETGADANNGSGTNTTTEADIKEVDLSLYTETDWYYAITDEANYGTDLVDGEELQNFNWDYVNKYVKLTDTLECYTHEKYNTGFLKANITVVYLQTNGEWSTVGWEEDGIFGYIFVKTAELEEIMEVTGDYTPPVEETETAGMSEKAEAYFDKIRARVAEYNEDMAELQEQYPNSGYQLLEETTSPEDMEYITSFTHGFDNEEDYATIIDVIRQLGFNQFKSKYYLEYVSETETSVEYKLYLAD